MKSILHSQHGWRFALIAFSIGLTATTACTSDSRQDSFSCSFDDAASINRTTDDYKVTLAPDIRLVEGVRGKALEVSDGQVPMRVDFKRGLPIEQGRIEYWIKLLDPSAQFTGSTHFLSFNGWHMMHRITTNSGTGTCGWQAGLGGFHLYGFKGCCSRPYTDLFPADADPKAWHHYEFVWNTNGIHGAETKVFQYLIDGRETLTATKSDFDATRFVSHMNTCKNMAIGAADKDITEHPFLIDELTIHATDR